MKISLANIEDVFKAKKCGVDTMELRGYELIENLFVDNSGFGSPDEPALTGSQFIKRLTEILKIEGQVTATITGEGQFQVYVGIFKKTGAKKSERIGNNTLRVNYPDREAIRLHDTDILTFQADHVKLDSGGWRTHTTKARINQYLPSGVRVTQKDFEWFVEDSRDHTVKPFVDGMTISS